MNKKLATIIIAIFLISTATVSAASLADGFNSIFDNMNAFFAGGWQRYDALLSFALIFVLLFSAAYTGLKKAFIGDDKTKSRPAMGIALAFAAIGAIGIVSGFGFRIEKYGFMALGFLLIMLVFIIYAVLLKVGLEKHKLLALLIALIIVGVILLFTTSIMDSRGINLGGLGGGGSSIGSSRNIFSGIANLFKGGGKPSAPKTDELESLNFRIEYLNKLDGLRDVKWDYERQREIAGLLQQDIDKEERRRLLKEEKEVGERVKEIVKKGITESDTEKIPQYTKEKEYVKELTDYCLGSGGSSLIDKAKQEISKVAGTNDIERLRVLRDSCKKAHFSEQELSEDDRIKLSVLYKQSEGAFAYETGKYYEDNEQYKAAQIAYLDVLDKKSIIRGKEIPVGETGYEDDAVAKLKVVLDKRDELEQATAEDYYLVGSKMYAHPDYRDDGKAYLEKAESYVRLGYKGETDKNARAKKAKLFADILEKKKQVTLDDGNTWSRNEQKELDDLINEAAGLGEKKTEEVVVEPEKKGGKLSTGALIALIVMGVVILGGGGLFFAKKKFGNKDDDGEKVKKEITTLKGGISSSAIISEKDFEAKISKIKEAKSEVMKKINKIEGKKKNEFDKVLEGFEKKKLKKALLGDSEYVPFLPDEDAEQYKELEKIDKELSSFIIHNQALEKDIAELGKIEDHIINNTSRWQEKFPGLKDLLNELKTQSEVIKNECNLFFNIEKKEDSTDIKLKEDLSDDNIKNRLKDIWRKDVVENEVKLKALFGKEKEIYDKLKGEEGIIKQNKILDSISEKLKGSIDKEKYEELKSEVEKLLKENKFEEVKAKFEEAKGQFPEEKLKELMRGIIKEEVRSEINNAIRSHGVSSNG